LLRKYLISEFFIRFLAILIVLVSLYIGIDLLSKFWLYNVDFFTFLKFYVYKLWHIVSQMLSVSILIATLSLFTSLAKNNELLALYACGRSLFSIVKYLALLSFLICVFSFYFNDSFVPNMEFAAKEYWTTKILKKESLLDEKIEKTWFRGSNFIFNIEGFEKDTLYSVNVYYQDKNLNILKHIFAPKIIYRDELWLMPEYKKTIWLENKNVISENLYNANIDLNVNINSFSKIEKYTEYLSLNDLRSSIKELKLIGMDPYKFKVKLYDKYAFSIIPFIMFLLAIPFSVRQSRQGGIAVNVGFSFILVLFYWILYSFFINYGTAGLLNPIISAWGVNAFFLFLAIFSFKKLKK